MAKRMALSFTDSEMIELHRWNETGLPLSTAVKWLVLDSIQILSGKNVTTPIGSNTLRPGSGKIAQNVTTPREDQDQIQESRTSSGSEEEEKREGRGNRRVQDLDLVSEVARLLVELDWREAKLPKNTTVAKFADSLIAAYPKLDVPDQLRKAQNWHLSRQPSWKRLGQGLARWFGNAEKWQREQEQNAQSALPLEPGETPGWMTTKEDADQMKREQGPRIEQARQAAMRKQKK